MNRRPIVSTGIANKGRAAIYCRVSNVNDERTASLDTQRDATALKLRAAGYTVDLDTDVFVERYSGAELGQRVELSRLREAVRNGTYQAVGFHALDRLSRDMGHTAIIFSDFADRDVEPISATEQIEQTPEGQLMVMIRSFFAQIERAKIKERMDRGRNKIIDEGKLICGGFCKFGYVYTEDRKRAIDPEAAAIVRRVFDLAHDDEMSATGIAKLFNTQGVPTQHGYRIAKGLVKLKKGGAARVPKWTACSVLLILKDPTYMGVSWANRSKVDGRNSTGSFRMVKTDPSEWKLMPDETTPAIVSKEVFASVLARISDRRTATSKTRNGARPFLLRGMCFCSECGRAMYCDIESTQQFKVYRCRRTKYNREDTFEPRTCKGRRMKASFVEPAAWDALVAILKEPGRLESAIDALIADGKEDQLARDLDTARKNLADAEEQQAILYSEYRKALKDKNQKFADMLKCDWEQQDQMVDSFKRTVREIENRLSARTSKDMVASAFRARFDRVMEALERGDVTWEEKRLALEAAGTRVVGSYYEADIHFEVFDPTPVCGDPSISTGQSTENTSTIVVHLTRELAEV